MEAETTEIVMDDVPPLQQIAKGELESQIDIARRYPRTLTKVREAVLELATLDEETAQECFFSLPRGGKTITGESVRLAEILASSYEHLRAGSRVIGVDLVRGVVTVQGVCHDVQKNVSTTVEKTRKIVKKRGRDDYDEDMITLATNAACAIAYRDAVFKVVPKALIKPIIGKIKEAARGKGTLNERRSSVLKRFKDLYDIDEKRIFDAMDIKSSDDITLSILDTLIGMGTALKNGEYTVEDLFPTIKVKKRSETEEKGQDLESEMGEPAASEEEKEPEPDGGEDESPSNDDMPDAALKKAFKKALKDNSVTIAAFSKWADDNKFGKADDWTHDVMSTFIDTMPSIAEQIRG